MEINIKKRSTSWVGLLALVLLLIVPIEYALLVDVFLFSSLVWFNFIYEKENAIPFIFLSISISFSFIYYVCGIEDVLPWLGTVIYGAMSVSCIIKCIVRRVLSLADLVWIVSLTCSSILSVLLRPNLSFVYVPLLVLFIGQNIRKRTRGE